jgi:hypothetical protein
MRKVALKDVPGLTGQLAYWAYNALDCIGTLKVSDVLETRLDPPSRRWYGFEMAAQGPAFAMQTRGILVDTLARDEAVAVVGKEVRALVRQINKFPEVSAVWDGKTKETGQCAKSTRKDLKHTWEPGVPDTPDRHCLSCGMSRFKFKAFEPSSPAQKAHLFYDLLKAKRQFGKTGELTVDDEALMRIAKQHPKIAHVAEAILEFQRLNKQLGFLKARLTPDGRYPSSFNVGAAWTDRWSSSKDPFGLGSNAQNISERHRKMFIADPGMELVYGDLSQAESNIVAHLSGDEGYIEAHKLGDPHTYVARLVWPDAANWTGDIKADKKLAKGINPTWDPAPGHDLRFQAKRIQHGGNYGLTPFGISMIAHIPVVEARAAQKAYFRAFPGIRAWQRSVAARVVNSVPVVSPLGRSVLLFGRPWDERTYKQGLAVGPQGTVAHIINIAVWRMWKELDPDRIRLLAQVHDALVWLERLGDDETLRRALQLMAIPIPVVDVNGISRYVTIKTEAERGLNWGHADPEHNPDGLQPFDF